MKLPKIKVPNPHCIKHQHYKHLLGALTITSFVVVVCGAGPFIEGGIITIVGLMTIYDPTLPS